MIIISENYLTKIRGIIEEKAKFQKVMLIVDENVSNADIDNLYKQMKDLCVYNLMHISNLSMEELNNGYRVIVYLMSTNNFLKLKFENFEFVNIFIPTDECLLPYLLNCKNQINRKNDYLFLKNNFIDTKMLSSIYFNNFYNYFKNLLDFQPLNKELNFFAKEITNNSLVEIANNLPENYLFKDIEIIKSLDLNYEDLQLVQLVLIDAFLVLINKIKFNRCTLVDTYKIAKNDFDMVDKIYANAQNESLKELINLNYNYLINLGEECKKKILKLIDVDFVDNIYVENIINKIKNYVKFDSEILFYLFLFEIFEN